MSLLFKMLLLLTFSRAAVKKRSRLVKTLYHPACCHTVPQTGKSFGALSGCGMGILWDHFGGLLKSLPKTPLDPEGIPSCRMLSLNVSFPKGLCTVHELYASIVNSLKDGN